MKNNHIGSIFAKLSQTLQQIMQDLEEEGSAEVSWCFRGKTPAKNAEVGRTLTRVFKANGYYAEWGGEDCVITAVIEDKDLPPGYIEKWQREKTQMDLPEISPPKNIELEHVDTEEELSDIEDTDELEERIDPDMDVVFGKDDVDTNNFSSEEDESHLSPLSDSDEDETECPPSCNCINCKAERDED